MSTYNVLQFLLALYCCFRIIICQQFHENFIRPDFCTGKVLTSLESYLTFEAGSTIQCATICSLDANCLSVSFILKEGKCFLNFGLLADDCGNGVTLADSVYYKKGNAVKECMNNGTLVNNDCKCYGGYVGTYCGRLMTDCSEGYRDMYRINGIYEILPIGATQSFTVTCVMKYGPGRTVIFRHFKTWHKMNRNWAEYQDGFDLGDTGRWVGLEKLYWVSRSKTLDFHIALEKTRSPFVSVKIVYENFEMGNSSTNYQLLSAQLNRARSPVNVTDCLSSLIGSSFSSYDMDNNQIQGLDCPAKYGGGWWYNGECAQCNPTGNLYHSGGARTGVDDEIFWEPFDWTPSGINIWF